MDTVNVLILYGGEKATASREMLLSWLNSSDLHSEINVRVDAQKVAAMIAHMEGSIDQRVEERMNWADKGIFLLTPDERSEYGAPNVLEEFGRWIGQKGRRSMLTLRHEDVKVHSNAQGLVYVSFKFDHDVITKCSDRIKDFVKEVIPPEENSGDPEGAKAIIDNSTHYGNNATVGDNNTSFNIGSVGGNLAGRDSISGNVYQYHVAGDYHASPSAASQLQGKENPESRSASSSADSNLTGETVEISLPDLREFLSNKYGKQDLIYIIQQMGIDSDDFATSKMGLILDLLPYLQRRDQLNDLLKLLAKDSDKRLQKEFGNRNKFVISD